MNDSMHGDFPATLLRAQRKIERWRTRQRPRAQIPEELWREAAELACAHGINRTARALRLDYYSLKKHAAAAARSRERAPEFVEILPGGMPAPRPECTIEVEDESGAKMRIRLQGADLPDLPACLTAFGAGRAALTRAFREGKR
ncbi:MAG: hypothetical protein V2A58_18715 [Planctomycetota bacterium]